MIDSHRVPVEVFDDMTASGASGREAISFLASAQLSKHKLLIASIAGLSSEARGDADQAVAVLGQAERRRSAVIADLLSGPWVGAWATACARRVAGTLTSTKPLAVDLSYLSSLAVVAAIRVGVDTTLTLYVQSGQIYLPTMGSVLAPAMQDGSPVEIRVTDGQAIVSMPAAAVRVSGDHCSDDDTWQSARWLTAEAHGKQLMVALEDLDLYRNCYRMPVAGRISDKDFGRWSSVFREAWELLCACAPGRADELTAGLRAMVPLSEEETETGLSATSRSAFGALALTLPARPEHLAATLVHEFQHSKLSALQDLLVLYEADTASTYFAPWRKDARHMGGLLQGAYAFLAVSDLWNRMRRHPGAEPTSEQHFADLRVQVQTVLDVLETSPHLTLDGHRLVVGMQSVLEPLLEEKLPEHVVRTSLQTLADNQASWGVRSRHV